MRTAKSTLVVSLLLALFATMPAVAEHHETDPFLADFLADFDRTSDKLLQLAEEIPAEQYSWKPTVLVRSVSESFIHTATTNMYLAQILGVPAGDAMTPDMEKTVTSKEDVIATLKASQEHVRKAAKAATDLEQKVELFGGERSHRAVFLIIAGHSHEHLGQAIVYVRSLGLVPPWSR